jgi:hypothetical protein
MESLIEDNVHALDVTRQTNLLFNIDAYGKIYNKLFMAHEAIYGANVKP